MASTQKGTFGVVWSMGTTITGTGIGTHTGQSLDFGVESDEKALLTADGNTGVVIFYNHRENITFEVAPSAATLSAANTANILPVPGADVDVVDANDTEIAGTAGSNTRWHFISGNKRKAIDGETRLTFNLRRYEVDLPAIA